MSWDIFSKSGIQYLLTKLKVIMMDKRDFVELTKAQYDALPDTKLTDGKYYFLTDVNALTGNINDSVTTSTDTWSSSKISDELQGKNLLDNPWFTVNQRKSTVAQDTFGCDRWGGIYTWNNNIVSLSANNYIIQFFEDNFKAALNGKMITVSIMLANGNVISGSNTYSSSSDATYIDTEMLSCSSFNRIEYALGITAKTAVDIKAVKLELGTVSTLSSDTYPDYAFELAKCQSRKFDNDLYTNQGRILMTKDQKDNGAYNLYKVGYSSQTVGQVSMVVSSNGIITINTNGALTEDWYTELNYSTDRIPLSAKTYKLVGCPAVPNQSGKWVLKYIYYRNGGYLSANDTGAGCPFTLDGTETQGWCRIELKTGANGTYIFKPMITTDLNATYADYVPHALTNRELTGVIMTRIKAIESATAAANTVTDATVDVAISGYKAVGIVNFQIGSGGSDVSMVSCFINGESTLTFRIINKGAAKTGVKLVASVLYVKDNGFASQLDRF